MQIFTYIGPILVSCNPYKALPVFNKEFIKLYYDKVRRCRQPAPRAVRRDLTRLCRWPQRYDAGALPPHAYQVTSAAYEQMLAKKHNQSMVISGAWKALPRSNPQAAESADLPTPCAAQGRAARERRRRQRSASRSWPRSRGKPGCRASPRCPALTRSC